MNKEQLSFIQTIYKECLRYGEQYGNACPIAVTAQAALESNYGKSILSKVYHNYFGLKASANWKGETVRLKTKEEYVKGELVTIYANFRVFPNVSEGVKGYYDFISTKRYANLKGITDPIVYLSFIKDAGYATSSKYVTNVYRVVLAIKPYLASNPIPSKTVREVAGEVIQGKWGSGQERKDRLELAGYSYREVQNMVNDLLR